MILQSMCCFSFESYKLDRSRKTGENICVYVRLRPLSNGEKERGNGQLFTVNNGVIRRELTEQYADIEKTMVTDYPFEHVGGPQVSTIDLYHQSVREKVLTVLDGINASVLAYGQTSSGKTHTIMGGRGSPGVVTLAIQDLWQHMGNAKYANKEFMLTFSFYEIYNEEIYDLLVDNPHNNQPLRVREKRHGKGREMKTFVEKLTHKVVHTTTDVAQLIARGVAYRHTSATRLNRNSSRGHTVLSIRVDVRSKVDHSRIAHQYSRLHPQQQRQSDYKMVVDEPGYCGVLNLVDLAGSERINIHSTKHDPGSDRTTRKEGGYINKSLYTLGTVITRLSSMTGSKHVHVPYRDSKLTRVLQESLGGNSRTTVICCVTPATCHHTETISTLNFGKMAANVTNDANVNNIMTTTTRITSFASEFHQQQQSSSSSSHPNNESYYMNPGNTAPYYRPQRHPHHQHPYHPHQHQYPHQYPPPQHRIDQPPPTPQWRHNQSFNASFASNHSHHLHPDQQQHPHQHSPNHRYNASQTPLQPSNHSGSNNSSNSNENETKNRSDAMNNNEYKAYPPSHSHSFSYHPSQSLRKPHQPSSSSSSSSNHNSQPLSQSFDAYTHHHPYHPEHEPNSSSNSNYYLNQSYSYPSHPSQQPQQPRYAAHPHSYSHPPPPPQQQQKQQQGSQKIISSPPPPPPPPPPPTSTSTSTSTFVPAAAALQGEYHEAGASVVNQTMARVSLNELSLAEQLRQELHFLRQERDDTRVDVAKAHAKIEILYAHNDRLAKHFRTAKDMCETCHDVIHSMQTEMDNFHKRRMNNSNKGQSQQGNSTDTRTGVDSEFVQLQAKLAQLVSVVESQRRANALTDMPAYASPQKHSHQSSSHQVSSSPPLLQPSSSSPSSSSSSRNQGQGRARSTAPLQQANKPMSSTHGDSNTSTSKSNNGGSNSSSSNSAASIDHINTSVGSNTVTVVDEEDDSDASKQPVRRALSYNHQHFQHDAHNTDSNKNNNSHGRNNDQTHSHSHSKPVDGSANANGTAHSSVSGGVQRRSDITSSSLPVSPQSQASEPPIHQTVGSSSSYKSHVGLKQKQNGDYYYHKPQSHAQARAYAHPSLSQPTTPAWTARHRTREHVPTSLSSSTPSALSAAATAMGRGTASVASAATASKTTLASSGHAPAHTHAQGNEPNVPLINNLLSIPPMSSFASKAAFYAYLKNEIKTLRESESFADTVANHKTQPTSSTTDTGSNHKRGRSGSTGEHSSRSRSSTADEQVLGSLLSEE